MSPSAAGWQGSLSIRRSEGCEAQVGNVVKTLIARCHDTEVQAISSIAKILGSNKT